MFVESLRTTDAHEQTNIKSFRSDEPECSLNFFLAKESFSTRSFWQQQWLQFTFTKYEIFLQSTISLWELLEACGNLDYFEFLNLTLISLSVLSRFARVALKWALASKGVK
jgi:hypothetical protein